MNRVAWHLSIFICCLMVSGCSPTLESNHGAVKRPSINGLGLFVDMLRADGRRADVLPALNDRLYRYNTIIVFHHGLGGLQEESVKFLRDDWDSEQTIVVAFRDCDWAIDYWEAVAKQLDSTNPEEAAAAREAAVAARAQMRIELSASKAEKSDFGFSLQPVARTGDERARKVQYLSPNGSLAGELDVDFPLNRRLTLPPVTLGRSPPQVLWRVGDDPLLVSDQHTNGPRTLILGTTAPLLNGGLIQSGNRKLIEQLLEKLDRSEPIAVVTSSIFLDENEEISMWRFAKIFPHPWILGQSLLALIVFCWWRWPIFGRPHTDQFQETKRFGRHVSAVGELLASTGKVSFALQCLHEWQRVSQEHRKGRRG